MEENKKKALARNNAYRLLRERPRSEWEIRRRLEDKGYDGSTIDEVVLDLKKIGDINDQRFARLWVDSRMHSNPAGDVVLRHELKQKGIQESVIEATLEAKNNSYYEHEVAFNMAREKFELFKKLDPSTKAQGPSRACRGMDKKKAMKRVYDFLLRRGFKYDNIRKVIDRIMGQGNEMHEDR